MNRQTLICVECGTQAPPDAKGWRSFLTIDDEPAHYCPVCAAQEFGDDAMHSSEVA